MITRLWRALRRPNPEGCKQLAEEHQRAELERQVSAQLTELIAYMDRLGVARQTDANTGQDVGAPH